MSIRRFAVAAVPAIAAAVLFAPVGSAQAATVSCPTNPIVGCSLTTTGGLAGGVLSAELANLEIEVEWR